MTRRARHDDVRAARRPARSAGARSAPPSSPRPTSRIVLSLSLSLVLCLAAAACSSVRVEPGGGVTEGSACTRDEDCAEGLFCNVDDELATFEACERVWTCSAESRCSAAPGYLACSCDGEVFEAPAGCPGRKNAGPVAYGGQGDVIGEACDPGDLESFRFDAILFGTGFEAFEPDPGRVVARLVDPLSGQPGGAHGVFIAPDGAFSTRWSDRVRPGTAELVIEVLADADSDGACSSPGDRAWTVVARPDPESPGDLRAELDAGDPVDVELCSRW